MTVTDDVAESVALSVAALVLFSLIPFTGIEPLAELPYGLFLLLAGYAGIAMALAVTGATGDDPYAAGGRWRAAAVWSGCGVVVVLVVASVVVTAQTMDLRHIVEAQVNTLPYLLLQPVAALVFAVALAVATSHGVRPPTAGVPGARRLAEGLHLFVGCAAGGTLFLGGFAGPLLPGPVWLVGKALALMLAVLMVRRRLMRLADERRCGLPWRVLAPVAALNLIATMVVVGRPR